MFGVDEKRNDVERFLWHRGRFRNLPLDYVTATCKCDTDGYCINVRAVENNNHNPYVGKRFVQLF